MKNLIKEYIELEVKAIQNIPIDGIIENVIDIIYKNVVRRSDNNQMDLNCFFEALEELANRLFNHQDAYENLQEVIEVIKKHVSPTVRSNA